MILPDYPVENSSGDKLRRAPLAKKVAELISGFEGKESFVIGIEGQWGSGKTSFINMVLDEIKDDPNLIFINFNPWNFTGQNELIADFFSALLEELKDKVDKNILKTVKSYAGKLGVSYTPEISTPIGSFGFGTLGKSDDSLQKQRKQIDATLKSLDKKIVVIIDDTDRLDEDETKLIMKLVKMTANFPNTVFVLAYDREQVARKLGESGVGEEYLKKIIQVSFTLPVADEAGLRKILFSDIEETIKKIYNIQEVKLEGGDEKRWNDLVFKGIQKPFKTVRDIKRFVSSLRLNWGIIGKDEVNKIDFIAIEMIRIFAPSLYSGIAGNKSSFVNTLEYHFNKDDAGKARQAKFKELIESLPTRDLQESMEKICKALFPQLESEGYGSEWEKIWSRELQICAADRFDFYFQLAIPEGAISEVETNSFISVISNKAMLREKLIELAKDNKLRSMLLKVTDRIDILDEEKTKILVLSLWDLEKEIKADEKIPFDFDDIPTQVSRITYHSLKQLPKENRLGVLTELVKSTKTFFPSTRFVAMLNDQHKNPDGREVLVTEQEAETLRQVSLQKINQLVATNKLHEEKYLSFALFRWKEWEGEKRVKSYIAKLISKPKGLVIFLKGFVGHVTSTSGNYKQLDKKGIEPLYSLAEIEVLVNRITDKEMEEFTPEEKEVVSLFRNPPKTKWD